MELTKEQTAYIAGILDGEGYIGIYRANNKTARLGYSYTPVITVGNTSENLVKWLQETTKLGSVSFLAKKTSRHKSSWQWTVCANGIRLLLPQVQTILICKKEQARLVLEFLELTAVKHGCKGLSKEALSLRKSYYLLLNKLNKRGI